MTTQMLTQMLLATVSLCVLCETTVRSRPCAQLLSQPATSIRRLMRGRSPTLRPTQRQKRRGVAPWHQKSIIECSFRLFKVPYPH